MKKGYLSLFFFYPPLKNIIKPTSKVPPKDERGEGGRDTQNNISRFGIWWSVGLPYLEHYYHYILLVYIQSVSGELILLTTCVTTL